MKKIRVLTIAFLSLLSIISCIKENRIRDYNTNPYEEIDRQYIVGDKSVGQFATKAMSGSSLKELTPYIFNKDTVFYIANYDNGWIVIANDQRLSPIIASGEEGSFPPDQKSFPGINVWLEMMAEQVHAFMLSDAGDVNPDYLAFWETFPEVKLRRAPKVPKTKDVYDSLNAETYGWARVFIDSTYTGTVHNNVEHLIATKWGQGLPWSQGLPYVSNDYYVPTGCVAVAVSQMLYYLHYAIGKPTGLYHTVDISPQYDYYNVYGVDFLLNDYNSFSSRWDQMSLSSSGTHTDYVRDLMMVVGYFCGMQYDWLLSLAYTNTNCFTPYGINCYSSPISGIDVESNLRSGMPVIVSATPVSSNIGHTWIIDGIRQRTRKYTDRYRWVKIPDLDVYSAPPIGVEYFTDEMARTIDPNIYDGKIMTVQRDVTSKYYLMNWGYDGDYDNAEYSVSVDIVGWTPDVNGYTFNYNVNTIYGFN